MDFSDPRPARCARRQSTVDARRREATGGAGDPATAPPWRGKGVAAARIAGDCFPRTAHADGRARTIAPGAEGRPTRGESNSAAIARRQQAPRLVHRRAEAVAPPPPQDKVRTWQTSRADLTLRTIAFRHSDRQPASHREVKAIVEASRASAHWGECRRQLRCTRGSHRAGLGGGRRRCRFTPIGAATAA